MNPPARCREFLTCLPGLILSLAAVVTVPAQTPSTTINFNAASYAVHENAGTLTLRVVREGDVSSASTVQFATSNDTAVAGVDFQAVSGLITFGPAETNQTIAIPLLDNTATQGQRAFQVSLFAPTGAALGVQSNATMTIVDDEYAAVLDPWFQIGTGAANDIFAFAIQPDGRIVVGGQFIAFNGTSVARVSRLLPDGAIDASFDNGGGVDATVYALALQPDGGVIMGGDFLQAGSVPRAYLARLTSTSGLDTNFIPAVINNPVRAAAVQPDGRIVIAGRFTEVGGQSRNRVARLNNDGSLDSTFTPGTGANDSIRSLALQSDGRIIIGGQFTSFDGITRSNVARLLTNGLLDTTFNPGNGTDDEVRAVVIAPDGKIYIGGDFEVYDGALRSAVARLLPTGAVDPDFDPGPSDGDVVRVIAPLPDGRVWIGGSFGTAGGAPRRNLALLKADGTADEFDPGSFDNEVFAIAPQPDGSTLIAGQFSTINGISMNRIARLNTGQPVPVFELRLDHDTVNESNAGVVASVLRRATFTSTAEVQFETRNRSALAGSDFIALTQTLRFETNETAKRLVVPLVNDGATEPTEQFLVSLTNPAPPAVVGTVSNAVVEILDNDPGFTLSRTNYLGSEPAGQAVLTVLRGTDPIGPASLQVVLSPGTATPGLDYLASTDPLVFQPGETQKTFTVTLFADGLAEGTETVQVSLTNPTGGPLLGAITNATLTIDDHDGVFHWDWSWPATEPWGEPRVYVSRTGAISGPASVDYAVVGGTATAGLDYSPFGGTLHFEPDQIYRWFTYNVLPDGLVEGDETIVVQLRNPSPGNVVDAVSNLVITIQDNDAGFGFASTNVVLSENSPSVTLTVQRNDDGTNALTVDWVTSDGTALAGQNYVASGGTLYFATGLTSNTVTVPMLDDCLSEGDRAFTVSLWNPSPPGVLGTNAVAMVAIESNDRAGSRDRSFQTDPSFNYGMGLIRTLPVLRDGRIIAAAGWKGEWPFVQYPGPVVRLSPDGAVDPSFRCAEEILTGILLAADSDERVFTCGEMHVGDGFVFVWLDRLLPNGAIDDSFARLSWFGWAGDWDPVDIVVQPDARLLIARDLYSFGGHPGVSRFLADGTPDPGFDVGTGAHYYDEWRSGVRSVALQPDGRILLGGSFTNFNGYVRNGLVRLHTNGATDLSFEAGLGPTNEVGPAVSVIVVQPDSRILIAGGANEDWWQWSLPIPRADFTHVDGVPRAGVARLLPDGALDESFDPGEITGGLIRALALQQNGKVVIGGSFTNVQGFRREGLARLNRDGSLDLTFDPSPHTYNVVALALQPDGRIVISDATTGLWRVNGDPVPQLRDLAGLPVNRLVFSFRTQPGETYVVESSTNLVHWLPLSTNLADACQLRLTNSPSPSPNLFYRVVQPVP